MTSNTSLGWQPNLSSAAVSVETTADGVIGTTSTRSRTPQGSSTRRRGATSAKLRHAGSVAVQWAVAFGLMYVIWKWLVAPHVSKLFVVSPDLVISQIKTWWNDGTLRTIIWVTVQEAAVGFVIGSAIGIVLALMCGLLPSIFAKLVEPVVTAIYASPRFVIVPLLFVWLGSGFAPRVVLITLAIFAYTFVNTATGIRTVDPDQARMLQLLGAKRGQMTRKLLVPHTTGYIITGLTNGAPHAITVAIGAEILFGTTSGLGGTMYTQSELFNARDVLAALVVATIIAAIAIQLTVGLGAMLTRSGGRFSKY